MLQTGFCRPSLAAGQGKGVVMGVDRGGLDILEWYEFGVGLDRIGVGSDGIGVRGNWSGVRWNWCGVRGNWSGVRGNWSGVRGIWSWVWMELVWDRMELEWGQRNWRGVMGLDEIGVTPIPSDL